MNTACAEELNQLLKGTHMGASLFEDLKANVRDDQLRRLIDDCLKRLRKHEELLTHHVELMHEEPSEDSGFFGTLSELGAMVRQAMLDERELVNECMRYMESAIKALMTPFLLRYLIRSASSSSALPAVRLSTS